MKPREEYVIDDLGRILEDKDIIEVSIVGLNVFDPQEKAILYYRVEFTKLLGLILYLQEFDDVPEYIKDSYLRVIRSGHELVFECSKIENSQYKYKIQLSNEYSKEFPNKISVNSIRKVDPDTLKVPNLNIQELVNLCTTFKGYTKVKDFETGWRVVLLLRRCGYEGVQNDSLRYCDIQLERCILDYGYACIGSKGCSMEIGIESKFEETNFKHIDDFIISLYKHFNILLDNEREIIHKI